MWGVIDGGHVWFPTYDKTKSMLSISNFDKFHFYRYHLKSGELYTEEIDFARGVIERVKEHDPRGDLSIVVDCLKT